VVVQQVVGFILKAPLADHQVSTCAGQHGTQYVHTWRCVSENERRGVCHGCFTALPLPCHCHVSTTIFAGAAAAMSRCRIDSAVVTAAAITVCGCISFLQSHLHPCSA
jgi:hypothetical protein